MNNIRIPYDVSEILNTLRNNGYEAFVVGGCVRDSLLNREPSDWDITTNAIPSEVKSFFDKTIDTGIKHGTVTVLLNGKGYEITTYRIDGEYSDNRKPDSVIFTSSLKDDLSRRDFTINAMAYNDSCGVVDYFNGQEDLFTNSIKCVGNPDERFGEDALRILRAVRFSSQLGFNIEANTRNSMYKNRELIKNISAERINSELVKTLCGTNVKNAVNQNISIIETIIPEIKECNGFDQQNIHHDKDVLQHTLAVVELVEATPELRISAFLHDIGKPLCFSVDDNGQGHFILHHRISADISKNILKRLKFDNKTIDKVSGLVYNHMRRCEDFKRSAVKRFINKVGIDNLDDLFKLQIADVKGCAEEYRNIDYVLTLKDECRKIIDEKQPLSVRDLDINGYDLMNLGVQEGKLIGDILNNLIELVINEEIKNDKATLISKAIQLKAN